jgi:aspartate aminotransferase
MAFWDHVKMGPPDPILGVAEAYKKDPSDKKINVGVGAYRTDEGKPWILPSVQEAQKRIVDKNFDMEYAPITGVPEFVDQAVALAYGADSDAVKSKRVAALQSISGTGALRLASAFISMHAKDGKKPKAFFPNPTWGNHFPIFEHAGLQTGTYRYWDKKTLGLDLQGMIADIKSAPAGSVICLHSCAHNPTGVDPNLDQWKQISTACKEKGHFVLFDNAYQGFASGDPDKDIKAVRLFISEGHNVGLCQSFAKNFGLYGQRVGAFSILCENADEAARVLSQLKIVARAIYSNPPVHGARVVSIILSDPVLRSKWREEIKEMSGRIIKMREVLKQNLKEAGSTKNWDHITDQIGMFSYTGLTPEQCDFLTAKHHVYLTRNGRISMAGVTSKNVKRLAQAMHEASQQK